MDSNGWEIASQATFVKMSKLIQSSLFRGFDEDYVNDKENALSASFSKSRNLEDMAQFPSNFSVIKMYYKCLACFLFPRKLFYISHKFLVRHLCVSNHFPTAVQAEHWSQCGQKG